MSRARVVEQEFNGTITRMFSGISKESFASLLGALAADAQTEDNANYVIKDPSFAGSMIYDAATGELSVTINSTSFLVRAGDVFARFDQLLGEPNDDLKRLFPA